VADNVTVVPKLTLQLPPAHSAAVSLRVALTVPLVPLVAAMVNVSSAKLAVQVVFRLLSASGLLAAGVHPVPLQAVK
jgi:hypothetical protein